MTVTAARPVAAAAPAAPSWLVWAALWVVYIVWGSTYLAIRYVVESMPPYLSAGARFLSAAALVAVFVALRSGRAGFAMTAREAVTASIVGVLLLLGGNGLISYAEQSVPSGLAALIVAVIPLWVVVLRLFGGDRPRRRTVYGVVLGFGGVALLVLPAGEVSGGGGRVVLVVLASLFWAVGSYYGTRRPQPSNPGTAIAVQMAAGGLALLLTGTVAGETAELALDEMSGTSWIALAYLVVFGSLLAFTAYAWLLRVAPVSQVATYAYVNPVVAVALGAVIAGEAVTGSMVVAGLVIVAAVAIVVREESRAKSAAAVEEADPRPRPATVGASEPAA